MERYETALFRDVNGQRPFLAWLERLDGPVRARIEARLNRLRNGNWGDCRHLERGLYEARFPFGPGYRVYFGLHRKRVILLLGGGHNRNQIEDIFKALQDWDLFREAEA